MNQTIAVKFFNQNENDTDRYVWRLFTLPVGMTPDKTLMTRMNLDQFFTDRETSIRFKGYSKNGRPLYHETNLTRKYPSKTNLNIDYYRMEDFKRREQ